MSLGCPESPAQHPSEATGDCVEGEPRKKRKRVLSPSFQPSSSTSNAITRSSDIKKVSDFQEWAAGNLKTWSSKEDTFVSVTTKLVKEIAKPVSDDRSRNLSRWLESDEECRKCKERRVRSGLKRRVEEVNWEEVAAKKKCIDVSRKVMALVSQGVEAAKSGFMNGDSKLFVFELLSLGYQSWLCSKHLSCIVKKMPGTVHDVSAIDIKSMWKSDNEIQLSDEISLKGLPDVVVMLSGFECFATTTITLAELKKNSWMDLTTTNKIVENDLDNSDMGQLLSYMYGKVIFAIQNGHSLAKPLLGIYVEGRKVVLVRAIVDEEQSQDGTIYSVVFGHTALGSHAIDIFSPEGILSIILISSRFVSSMTAIRSEEFDDSSQQTSETD